MGAGVSSLLVGAEAAGTAARHSSKRLLERDRIGWLSILEIAEQLGQPPTVCFDTYGHVMRELAGGEQFGAEEQIVLAREALADDRSQGAQVSLI